MSDVHEHLQARRHLYEELARGGHDRRTRRTMRRYVRLLSVVPPLPPGDGPSGVREPRRPKPSAGPASR